MDIPSLPPDETPIQQPEATPALRDRSSLLAVFGVVQIILGAFCLLFIPFMLLGIVVAHRTGGASAPLSSHLIGMATYFGLGVAFIWLGIGSIMCCRWARALTLVASWIGLVSGILIVVILTAILPTSVLAGMHAAAAQNPQAAAASTGVLAVIFTVIIVFCAILFIAIPIAFILFYRRSDVAETCNQHDPVERWTDHCPLPVLAACVLFASAAALSLLVSVTTPIIPLFGRYITGIPASAAFVLVAAFDFFLAFTLFRLRLYAWWLAVCAVFLRVISAAITYWRADIFQAYSRMGWSSHSVNILRQNLLARSGVMLWWSLGFSLIFLGYLVYLKKYFRPAEPQPGVSADNPPMPILAS